MAFYIELADILVEIEPAVPETESFFRDYIVSGSDAHSMSGSDVNIVSGLDVHSMDGSDAHSMSGSEKGSAAEAVWQNEKKCIKIHVSEEALAKERQLAREAGSSAAVRADYLETLAILRQIADQLPEYDRLLCHGAVITWKDRAFMFTAPSGTGKSTHIALWRRYLGSDVQIVNGDKPILAVKPSVTEACGTPWSGKEHWHRNRKAPLGGICILRQADKNHIRRLEAAQALPYLMGQIYFPAAVKTADQTLALLDRLLKNVPVYLLECNISEEAVRCSFEAMTGMKMPERP